MYKQGVAASKGCYYKVLKYLEIKHELFKIKQNRIFPFCSTHENYQNTGNSKNPMFFKHLCQICNWCAKKIGVLWVWSGTTVTHSYFPPHVPLHSQYCASCETHNCLSTNLSNKIPKIS